jgi:hypothetical protein
MNHILNKIKAIKPNSLTDTVIVGFLNEALKKVLGNEKEYTSYIDDVLMYYALAQISLYQQDLDEYNNFMVLYNSSLIEFKKLEKDITPTETIKYINLW